MGISLRNPKRRGAATVEFAVLLPLLTLLLLGVWEVGRLLHVTQVLDNAAREGARQASFGGTVVDVTYVQTSVRRYLERAGLPTANVVITVVNETSGEIPNAANKHDKFRIRVSIPFADIRWIALQQITDRTTLWGEAVWWSLRDENSPDVTDPDGF